MEAVFAWPGPTSDDRLQEPRFCLRCARPLSVRAAVSKTEDPTAAKLFGLGYWGGGGVTPFEPVLLSEHTSVSSRRFREARSPTKSKC